MLVESYSTPTLKIAGRSGCQIEIIMEAGRAYVKKYASGLDYNIRLIKQYEKQKQFGNSFKHMQWFKVPKIIEEGTNLEGVNWFCMDYVTGEKATTFLADADSKTLKKLVAKFLYYFSIIEKASIPCSPPLEAIATKNESLFTAIDKQSHLPTSINNKLKNYLYSKIPESYLPLGFCHGDFTLSNMLFGKNDIFIFDFLDSFIESPLVDIVKLRQDTRFGWTLMLDETISSPQSTRIKIAQKYIDQFIEDFIINHEAYSDWYNYLELYNLARILPYVGIQREIEFLEQHIRSLLS